MMGRLAAHLSSFSKKTAHLLKQQSRRSRRWKPQALGEPLEARLTLDSTVVFNEIMYNPAGSDAGREWIELHNQMAVDMDLSGWRIDGGVEYDFAEGTVIPGGGYLVVAADPSRFADVNVVGPLTGRLNNAGETLELYNHFMSARTRTSTVVHEIFPTAATLNGRRRMDVVQFDDRGDWPNGADGSGASLVKRWKDASSHHADNWTFSSEVGGTPGRANFPEPKTAILERISDSSGNDRHGEPFGVTLTSADGGHEGQAGFFNGISSFVDVGIDLNPEVRPQATIGAWVRPSQVNVPARHEIISTDNGGFDRAITIDSRDRTSETNVGRYGAFGGARTGLVSGTTAEADKWVFVAASFDHSAEVTSLYVDTHEFVGDATHNGSQSFARIGAHPFGIEYFRGSIDNVFFFDGILSANHIEAIRTGGSEAIKATPHPLLGLYEFEDSIPAVEAPEQPALPSFAFSELLAGGTDVEIWNTGNVQASTTNLVLGNSSGDRLHLPAFEVAAGDYVSFSTSDLKLSVGDPLFLFGQDERTVIDGVRVESQNRALDTSTHPPRWLVTETPTLGETNQFALQDAIVINEVLYHAYPDRGAPEQPATYATETLVYWNTNWRFNQNFRGTGLPPDWAAQAHRVDGLIWQEGPGPVGYSNRPENLPVEINTFFPIAPRDRNPRVTTFYFETDFEFMVPADDTTQLRVHHMIDDGAVFYINGVEFGRFNLPSSEITPETRATSVPTASVVNAFTIPNEWLQSGTNRLSVEVHQSTKGSSDVVLGAMIEIQRELEPHISGGPYVERDEEWVELYNRSQQAVDLTGWKLHGGIDYAFPDDTVIAPDAYLVVSNRAEKLRAKYPEISRAIVGDFTGRLANASDTIVLVDAVGNPADELTYFDRGRWPANADGRGASVELIDPWADNRSAEAWQASHTNSAPWQTIEYTGVARDDLLGTDLFHELVLGLLNSGEVLIDDIEVIKDPQGDRISVIQNGDFQADVIGQPPAKWRVIGTHGDHGKTVVTTDPDNAENQVLRLTATGPTEDKHNHASTTFAAGETIDTRTEYSISFRAKWLSGSNQLNTRLYFNYLQRTFLLNVPDQWGTPGEVNSTRVASNTGPTYAGLLHSPVIPQADDSVSISVRATDLHGVSTVKLWYAANGEGWTETPMTLSAGRYQGLVPPHPPGTAVRFYVEGQDNEGAITFFPATGAEGGAFFEIEDYRSNLGKLHNLRIIMDPRDVAFMYRDINRMSNDRLPATVVYDERDVFYDVGVRLKGSAFGRNNDSVAGLSIRFQPDQLFRGVHETLSIERAGDRREIVAKHMLNRAAGGLQSFYDDIAHVITPRDQDTGIALFAMARTGDIYFESLYEDPNKVSVFNLELLYSPRQTIEPRNPESPKRNFPYTHDRGRPEIEDLGSSKETYRWNFQLRGARSRDDYEPLIAAARVFSMEGQALENAVSQIIDVDQWMRTFAMLSLNGNDDVYTRLWEHNFRMYVAPDTGKLIAVPWDLDRAFRLARTATPWGTLNNANQPNNVAKIIELPVFNRLFWGHIVDIANNTATAEYMTPWTEHLGKLAGQNFTGIRDHLVARADWLLEQTPAPLAFQITTNQDNEIVTDTASFQLTGEGWVDVRELRLSDGTNLPVTWLDERSWQTVVPLSPGTNKIDLVALNHQHEIVGTDNITIVMNTVNPVVESLRISEINYHPLAPSNAERLLIPDVIADDFEFIEILNIGSTPIDLTSVRFDDGINFTFPREILAPDEVAVVVRNAKAFVTRYGDEIRILGKFASGSLRKDGETLRVSAKDGTAILDFAYDNFAPWPTAAAGQGATLEIIDVRHTAPLAFQTPHRWQASPQIGGTPGRHELNTLGDLDGNGQIGADDLNHLCEDMSLNRPSIDLNRDGRANRLDLEFMVADLLGTHFGDANLDGTFNSADMVFTMLANLYEDGIANNAAWTTGDWNCDGDFDSEDIVEVFRRGGYTETANASSLLSLLASARTDDQDKRSKINTSVDHEGVNTKQ